MPEKLTIEFIKMEFEKEGYLLLSKEYSNNSIKLDYICSEGHKHNIAWGKWQQGRRCPECGNKLISYKLKKDILKQKFGRLLVLEEAGRKGRKVLWKCLCDCGKSVTVSGIDLRRGHTKSCGCYRIEKTIERQIGKPGPLLGICGKDHPNYRHGLTGTKEYINMYSNKRRATKLNQTPENANLQKIQLYYSICAYLNSNCEIPMWHVDHIRPISKGGLHHEDNLQILTAEINLQKSAKYPLTEEEEIKYKGIMI